jgi:holo-[acyl-carrier protein] synthase
MRIYQGLDIVDVDKFRKLYERHSGFGDDIFTEKEREYCFSKRDPYPHLAGRFAAKEACLKALGIGLGSAGRGRLGSIEVLPEGSGRPVIRLSGWVERLYRRLMPGEISVSISHSGGYSVSSVIIFSD